MKWSKTAVRRAANAVGGARYEAECGGKELTNWLAAKAALESLLEEDIDQVQVNLAAERLTKQFGA